MFEGKELEGALGDVGTYSIDVDSKGVAKVEILLGKEEVGMKAGLAVELDILVLLEKAAAKTPAAWDDSIIAKVKAALGR